MRMGADADLRTIDVFMPAIRREDEDCRISAALKIVWEFAYRRWREAPA
jgi:hypothetical protein